VAQKPHSVEIRRGGQVVRLGNPAGQTQLAAGQAFAFDGIDFFGSRKL